MAGTLRVTKKTLEKIKQAFIDLALQHRSKKVQVTYKQLCELTGLSIATTIRGTQALEAEGLITALSGGNRRQGKVFDVGLLLRDAGHDIDDEAGDDLAASLDPGEHDKIEAIPGHAGNGMRTLNGQAHASSGATNGRRLRLDDATAKLEAQIAELQATLAALEASIVKRRQPKILHRIIISDTEELWHIRK